jgi:hypothetical protein
VQGFLRTIKSLQEWTTARIIDVSCCSVVGIETGYGLDGREVGVRVPVGLRILTSPYCPDRHWGVHNFVSNGYWGLLPGVKRPGREADHSPQTNAGVKRNGSTHPISLTLLWRSAEVDEHVATLPFSKLLASFITTETIPLSFCPISLGNYFLKGMWREDNSI